MKNKFLQIIITALITFSVLLGITGTNYCNVLSKKGSSIYLDITSCTMVKGGSLKLKPKFNPAKKKKPKVKWKSSNKKIVSVTKEGKIKGLKAGTATVTARMNNGSKSSCKVKVIGARIALTAGKKTKVSDNTEIDYSHCSEGYIMVRKKITDKVKVYVESPGKRTYSRIIIPDADIWYPVPLQSGSGKYTVSLCIQEKGEFYRVDTKAEFSASFSSKDINYLYNNIYSNYSEHCKSIKKSLKLCNNKKSDLAKVRAIYKYIIKNIKYDKNKMKKTTDEYIPELEEIYSSKKGICFDYASLFAAMCRANNIKNKVVLGYHEGDGHAWNEVYIKGKGKIAKGISSKGGWKRLDSTFAAAKAPAKKLEDDSAYSPSQYY